MKLDDLVSTARDAVTVKRVFADPYEKDGVTVIPTARVGGGGGGGRGTDEKGQEGEGGGFGVGGRPVGVYTIRNGEVAWIPAVDVNRIIVAMSTVAVTYLITRARVAKARLKAAPTT